MNNKLYLVIIALVGIGLYALPQTVALFAGQHSFTNIDPTGNQIECGKCHGDVGAELSGAVNTQTGTKPPHAVMKCEFCHRLQVGQSSGDNAYALITYQNDTSSVAGNGKITITAGKIKRYAVIAVGDYEASSYATTINNTDVIVYNASARSMDVNGVPVSIPKTDISYVITGSYSPAGTTPVVLTSAGTALCGGTLINASIPSDGFMNQTLCKGSGGKLYPLVVNGVPLDNVTSTQFTAFTPRLVNWTYVNETAATPTFDNAGSRAVNKGSKYHAASLVACLDCHGGSSPSYAGHETSRVSTECQLCHYGGDAATVDLGSNKWINLEAGGFGMGLTNAATDNGASEVHKSMVVAQDSISVYGGRYAPASNDACIACHTQCNVDIQFTRPNTLTYSAVEDGLGNWTESNFVATGSNTTMG
jgi:hypothetical protein